MNQPVPNDCMYCAFPLAAGPNDSWSHYVCDLVTEADNRANEVIDNGPLDEVETRLLAEGRCSYQIRARGWDGPGVYCGREITEHGDDEGDPNRYCLEHECTVAGDDEGAAEELWTRTRELLGLDT